MYSSTTPRQTEPSYVQQNHGVIIMENSISGILIFFTNTALHPLACITNNTILRIRANYIKNKIII